MKKIVVLLFAILFAFPALAQVQQSGTVTTRHVACWTVAGVIQDCGTAADPFPTSFGTIGQGPTICANSAPITGAYNRLCFGANTNADAVITSDMFGGAVGGNIVFSIDGNAVFSITPIGASFSNYGAGVLRTDIFGNATAARVAGGIIQMARKSTGPWFFTDPDATTQCTSGADSTNSQCLQEAINYAFNNQYVLKVRGGGSGFNVDPPQNNTQNIYASTGITIPPLAGHYGSIEAVSLFFCSDPPDCTSGAPKLTTDGFLIDSTDFATFEMRGQIGYQGAAGKAAWHFKPTKANQEGFVEIFASEFILPSTTIALNNPASDTGIGALFTTGGNTIGGSHFYWRELGFGALALSIEDPTGSGSFSSNTIEVSSIHTIVGDGIHIGGSATGKIFGNVYKLPIEATGVSYDSYGINELFLEGRVFGGTTGFKFRTGANNNIVISPLNRASVPVSDAGNGNTFLMPGFLGTGNSGMYVASGATLYNNVWTAQNGTGAAVISSDGLGSVIFYANTGTTAGVTFNPTERFRISAGIISVAGIAAVSCSVGTLNPTTAVVTQGIITHC